MTGSWIPAMRASDADRERAVRILREAAVDGRLSHDSFVDRVDIALQARGRDELLRLVGDLAAGPVRVRTPDRARRVGHWWSSYARLPLTVANAPLVIGRRSDCDLVIDDVAVSRVHAVLLRFEDTWVLADHGSKNGTSVNGQRLVAPTAVFAGDLVRFGRSTYQLVAPRWPWTLLS
jgi:FHA domain/DUF1707 SHOCT-like domain